MFTITLTIGRNLGKAAGTDQGKPMDDARWAAVQREAETLLRAFVGTADSWTETHIGIGEWEGAAEESAKIMLGAADLTGTAALRAQIAWLADLTQQDAIAVSVGFSELVTPNVACELSHS